MVRGFQLPAPLERLAEVVGGEVRGGTGVEVRSIQSLDRAGPEDLGFVLRASYLPRAAASRAGALLLGRDHADADPRPRLVVDDAEMALVALLQGLEAGLRPAPGVHPAAVVAPDAVVEPSATVEAYAVIGAGVRVGPRTRVGSHTVVGAGCALGAEVVLHPHVVLYARTTVGDRTIVHAGTVLGADGFGYVSRGLTHHRIPHLGRTVVEEDVEIGALSAVDRAQTDETVVGAGTRIDNHVQVGHNARIGRGCILCGQVGVSGSARLADGVVLGGKSGVADHVELVSGVQLAGMSAALQSLDEPGPYAGAPAIPLAVWRRASALFPRLQDLSRRIRKLERRLGEEEETKQ